MNDYAPVTPRDTLWQCPLCGAVVASRLKHQEWHEAGDQTNRSVIKQRSKHAVPSGLG